MSERGGGEEREGEEEERGGEREEERDVVIHSYGENRKMFQ